MDWGSSILMLDLSHEELVQPDLRQNLLPSRHPIRLGKNPLLCQTTHYGLRR